MKRLSAWTAGLSARFDRQTIAWGVAPAAAAAAATLGFAVPNYIRANGLRDETQRLEAVAGENISQRNNLVRLERTVADLRAEAQRRSRALAVDGERDALLDAVTRHADGTVVVEQSIRTGVREPATATVGVGISRRQVTVEMTASFDGAFGVLDAADGIDRLATPRIVEFAALAPAAEQAIGGNPTVRCTFVFDEWFRDTTVATATSSVAGGRP
jgi:hypothetical protein